MTPEVQAAAYRVADVVCSITRALSVKKARTQRRRNTTLQE